MNAQRVRIEHETARQADALAKFFGPRSAVIKMAMERMYEADSTVMRHPIAATTIIVDGKLIAADLIIEDKLGRWYATDLGVVDGEPGWAYVTSAGGYIPAPQCALGRPRW